MLCTARAATCRNSLASAWCSDNETCGTHGRLLPLGISVLRTWNRSTWAYQHTEWQQDTYTTYTLQSWISQIGTYLYKAQINTNYHKLVGLWPPHLEQLPQCVQSLAASWVDVDVDNVDCNILSALKLRTLHLQSWQPASGQCSLQSLPLAPSTKVVYIYIYICI